MPLVHECSEPGCSTLTMGDHCIEHEAAPEPSPPQPSHRVAVAAVAAALAGVVAAFVARARFSL